MNGTTGDILLENPIVIWELGSYVKNDQLTYKTYLDMVNTSEITLGQTFPQITGIPFVTTLDYQDSKNPQNENHFLETSE